MAARSRKGKWHAGKCRSGSACGDPVLPGAISPLASQTGMQLHMAERGKYLTADQQGIVLNAAEQAGRKT